MVAVRVSVSKSLSITAEHPQFGLIEFRFDRISAQHLAAQLRAHAGVPMAGGPDGSAAALPAELVRAQPAALQQHTRDALDAVARRIAGVGTTDYNVTGASQSDARAAAILSCEEAQDRQQLARHIAENTSMPLADARRLLAASGVESEDVDFVARQIASYAKRH
jgi:hypothetical protein